MEACRKMLVSGLEALNLQLSEDQIEKLLNFIALIEKWNKAYNLTAIRNKNDMVGLHLLDSLAILPFIEGRRVIDIGTGAGLPGIPLAICLPEIEFMLLDANAKKTRFVQQAIVELKLKNTAVCHQRVENYHPEKPFDTAITRAFAGLADIVELTAHLLADDGVLLAMKGQTPEILKLESARATLIPVNVPGLAAERCLVRIQLIKASEVNEWEK
jgi:16S rRNA (guanine527-N7)-methyltransferase